MAVRAAFLLFGLLMVVGLWTAIREGLTLMFQSPNSAKSGAGGSSHEIDVVGRWHQEMTPRYLDVDERLNAKLTEVHGPRVALLGQGAVKVSHGVVEIDITGPNRLYETYRYVDKGGAEEILEPANTPDPPVSACWFQRESWGEGDD